MTRHKHRPDQVGKPDTDTADDKSNRLVAKGYHISPGGPRLIRLFEYFCYAQVRRDRDPATYGHSTKQLCMRKERRKNFKRERVMI
jgi:hypothetical protein